MTASAPFELQLMGRFGLRSSGEPADFSIASKKARALLAYVAMQEPMRDSREHLATLLWPDRTDRMARQNLRAAIASLRRELAGGPDILLADDETVGLSDRIAVDARRLRNLAQSGAHADLEAAARLYRGQFLSDLAPDGEELREWVLAERTKLDGVAGTVLAELASRADATGDGAKAIDFSSRLTAIDPFREDWLRLSLRIAARHLGRDKALLQARNFAALLKKELDVEPDAETAGLVERIKAGRIAQVETRYFYAADTSESIMPLPSSDRQSLVGTATGRRPGLAAVAAAAAVLVIAGLSIGYEFDVRGGWQRAAVVGRPAVDGSAIPLVVSPFQSQTAESDALARELTQRVLADVSRFSGLTVFDGRLPAGGRSGANDPGSNDPGFNDPGFLASGSVRTQGGVIRVSAALTDTANQAVVWAGDYAVNDDRIADLTERIPQQIARDFQIQATYALARGLDETKLDRAPLNQLIAKALTIQYRSPAADDEAAAARLYEAVLRRDRDNALALVGLAARLVRSSANMLSAQKSALGQAEQLIDRALRADPRIERAHYWRGIISLARGQRELALQSFTRALDLNPSFVPAEAHLGYALVLSGRADEGLRHIENALAETSHDPTERLWLRFAGIAQLELGDNGAAINTLLQAASLAAPAPPLRAALASAYALAGDRANSRAQFHLMKQTADPTALAHLLARAADGEGRQRSRYLQGLWLAADDSL